MDVGAYRAINVAYRETNDGTVFGLRHRRNASQRWVRMYDQHA